jgi:hypothetical protein
MSLIKSVLRLFGFTVNNCSASARMDSALPAQAHIHKIRLFFSGSLQVALYGSPSAVEDGWVANLPAAEVFVGDCSGLLFEVPIVAEEAHQRVGFHKEFYERHVRQAPQPSWPNPSLPPTAASPSADLRQQALQQLKGARNVALSLMQQARSEDRLEDQERWLEALAAVCVKASELEGDCEAAGQLREQALQQLKGARNVALSLMQQARSEDRLEDQERWLEALAALTVKASELEGLIRSV